MASKAKTPVTGVTKFQKIVASTGKDVLDQRAKIVFNATRAAMQDYLTSLERRKEALELELLNLTDLSVETTESLRPGNKNFKAPQWVQEMVTLKKELALLEDDLAIAEEVHNEYFEVVEE
jgi:hypothetical protein